VNPSGLNYIDGFAGPGVYSKGEDGSPVIAIKAALEHRLPLPGISFIFVEKDKATAGKLESVLSKRFSNLPSNTEYEVYHGEFAEVITRILDDFDLKGKTIAPTFTFVDPFGYGGFPMSVLDRLMKPNATELLITFMASRIRRFLDPLHENAMDLLYCTPDWRRAREMEGKQQIDFLLNLYVECLRRNTSARYVMPFEMADNNRNTIYYLIFATKHPKGCEVMKEAMWTVDPTGTYRFFDYADGVRRFELSEDRPEWVGHAQALIVKNFRGRSISIEDLEDFIRPTPFLWRKRKILVPLENSGTIVHVDGRTKRRTYPERCVITFSS
jgi:three-Cys-motif partner protein